MSFKVFITGSVYSLDPVRNVNAYARATFADLDAVTYSVDPNNSKKIDFSVLNPQTFAGSPTLTEVTEGLIRGDDNNTNIVWNFKVVTLSEVVA